MISENPIASCRRMESALLVVWVVFTVNDSNEYGGAFKSAPPGLMG